MSLTHGSLFSGIGGPEIAAEQMGWENIFHCEWNEFGRRVLDYYWPKAKSYEDITKSDFHVHRGRTDVLTGGFPCQPYSAAGKRLGTEDDRHLWPEMLRAIREIQPRWVVGENVLGLVNWNGGLVFHDVQKDLEAEGYEVQPFILPAGAVGAPHRRNRVFFVAYRGGLRQHPRGSEQPLSGGSADGEVGAVADTDGAGQGVTDRRTDSEATGEIWRNKTGNVFVAHGSEGGAFAYANDTRTNERVRSEREGEKGSGGRRRKSGAEPRKDGGNGNVADTDNEERIGRGNSTEREGEAGGQQRERVVGSASRHGEVGSSSDTESTGKSGERIEGQGEGEFNRRGGEAFSTWWQQFPTQSPICGGNDGLPVELDGITFPRWRTESIKAYGNAIVPAVMLQIFKAIEAYEILYLNEAE